MVLVNPYEKSEDVSEAKPEVKPDPTIRIKELETINANLANTIFAILNEVSRIGLQIQVYTENVKGNLTKAEAKNDTKVEAKA